MSIKLEVETDILRAPRQASLSDAGVSAILAESSVLGAGLGLGAPMIQEWQRTRPDLKFQLSYRCVRASPLGIRTASELFPSGFKTGMPLMHTWIRCKANDLRRA
jgi:hypothetical protein